MKLVRRFILSYAGLIDVSVLKRYKTSFKHEFLLTSSFNRLNLFPSDESTQFRGMSEVQKKIFERLLEQGRESIARSTRDTIMTIVQNKLTDGSALLKAGLKSSKPSSVILMTPHLRSLSITLKKLYENVPSYEGALHK